MHVRLIPICLLLSTYIFCSWQTASSTSKSVQYVVQEECGPDTFIGNPIRDANIPWDAEKPPLQVKLIYGKTDAFALNETTGDLHTTRYLDREAICGRTRPTPSLRLKAQRFDGVRSAADIKYANVAFAPTSATQKCAVELSLVVHGGEDLSEIWINVHIVVQDINDNGPFFEEDSWKLSLSESTPVGMSFPLPQAIDLDEAERSILHYGLVDESGVACRNHFSISCKSALVPCALRLVLDKPVDYESCQRFSLILFAEDAGPREAFLPLQIQVKGENEHQPQFVEPPTRLSLPRESQVGVTITKFQAVDDDQGEDGEVTFLTNSTYFHFKGGSLVLKQSLSHYQGDEMRIFVTATDSGSPPQQSSIEVIIEITGGEVKEQTGRIFIKPLGGDAISGLDIPLTIPHAAEKDTLIALIWPEKAPSKLTCLLKPALPNISLESAGLLMGKPTFTLKVSKSYNFSDDYEYMRHSIENWDVRVVCGVSQLYLRIRLAPPLHQQFRFPHKELRISIEESSSPILGFSTLMSLNGVGDIHFAVDRSSPGCDCVHIDARSGRLSIPHGIDRETTPSLHCRINAVDSDQPPNRISTNLFIKVMDINDCAPSLTRQHFSIPEFDSLSQLSGYSEWVPLLKLDAVDGDTGLNGSVKFELRSVQVFGNGSTDSRIPEFKLTPESGEVFIKSKDYPLLDREEISDVWLFVFLYDQGVPFRLSASYEVKLSIEDLNDNIPIFYDAEANGVLKNMLWYRSSDHIPGYWTHIRIYDPDRGENGTTELAVIGKYPNPGSELCLHPHQVILEKDGRLWVAKDVVKDKPFQVVYLRVVDHGSRRQLHSEAKLIVDPESDQHGRNQLKRPMFVRSTLHRAGKFALPHRKAGFAGHVRMILIGVCVGIVCCIAACACAVYIVLRK